MKWYIQLYLDENYILYFPKQDITLFGFFTPEIKNAIFFKTKKEAMQYFKLENRTLHQYTKNFQINYIKINDRK